MTNHSAAIVDFDGTLFDTRRAISATLRETFAAYNVPPPSCERIEVLIGRGINLEETLIHLMPQDVAIGKLSEWVVTYRRIYDSATGLCASTPFPGSRAALAQLHAAAIPVVIVSNKGEASVHAALNHFGMNDFVRLVVAARVALTRPFCGIRDE
jgi:phosphoglycolate phosphatase